MSSQTRIPPNYSQQHLVDDPDGGRKNGSITIGRIRRESALMGTVTRRQWITVAVLCYVNLINYMDRFTLAGVLPDIQNHYHIGDDHGGLLQTVFILSYMVFAPLFGYYGDRYNRKALMAFGVFLWSLTTLLGSFMENFGWFAFLRCMVGIGEASYSTIAPTILGDLFVKNLRTRMLALFYFAIPVGSGLGYIVGAETAKLGGSWQWGLRVTPALGVIAVLAILFIMDDPPRGESEGKSPNVTPTTWWSDIKSLCRNKSFILTTGGFTSVTFVAGALAWFGPKFIMLGIENQTAKTKLSKENVSFIFGAVTMVAGLVGVPLGSFLAQSLRPRYPHVDPLICGFGLLVSTPFVFLGALFAGYSTPLCFFFIFFGEIALNLNWAIVADIILYIVIPTRRSTAQAFQILISHTFGDAGSPYLVGLFSELFKHLLQSPNQAVIDPYGVNSSFDIMLGLGSANTTISDANNGTILDGSSSLTNSTLDPGVEFHSMQYAVFITAFVEVIGGILFLCGSWFILEDKSKAERRTAGLEPIEDSDGLQPTHLFADDMLSEQERGLLI